MSIVSARDVSKAYGAKTLFAGVSLTVGDGDRIGLVGVNGTGKSTLLKMMAAHETADHGILERRRDATVAYLAQEPDMDPRATPREVVGGETWLADKMLFELGVRALDKPVGEMSGGERRRVALAQILVAKPTLAILDEPTNHLDADTIDWLEDYLRDQHKGAVLMVTHDRYVLDAVATRIVELDRGTLFTYDGNYQDYLEQKAVRLEHDARVESNRQNFLRREVEWLRRGPKARTTKQKARIQRAEAALAVEAPVAATTVSLQGNAQRLGNTILDVENLRVERGGQLLIDGLTLHMSKGERIGIVGKNGAGKTSLLLAVMGELPVSGGHVKLGAQTEIAYFDQRRAELRDDWTVFDNVAERENALQTGGITVRMGSELIPLRHYLERFLFDAAQQRQRVSALSGGERARLTLAKALKSGANLLLLDEPTNDLDTHTLAALEDMLESWPGCALIVSHDRYFLNRVATAIAVFEGDGQVVKYQGNYDTYRALRPNPGGPAARASENQAPVADKQAADKRADKRRPGLTYAERLELEGLMDKIAAAEGKVATLEAVLADPALYATRGAEVPALQADLAVAESTVADLLARWEFLEGKKLA